jgi:hypothetical protein
MLGTMLTALGGLGKGEGVLHFGKQGKAAGGTEQGGSFSDDRSRDYISWVRSLPKSSAGLEMARMKPTAMGRKL